MIFLSQNVLVVVVENIYEKVETRKQKKGALREWSDHFIRSAAEMATTWAEPTGALPK